MTPMQWTVYILVALLAMSVVGILWALDHEPSERTLARRRRRDLRRMIVGQRWRS
jgi:hypothetical protein